MQIEDPHGWREACPKGKEPEEAEEKRQNPTLSVKNLGRSYGY